MLKRHLHSYVYYRGIHTSNMWNQPKCPPPDKWIKSMAYIHNRILCSHKKDGILSFPTWMNLGEYYVKWNKPETERQIPYDLTHM
jgi:hypothetical protein